MFKDDWNKVKQWFILIQPINGEGKGCAQDPMDPQHYGFLDPLKYADPWIRRKYADPWIQGAKYQPKMEEKKLLPKPNSELMIKERF